MAMNLFLKQLSSSITEGKQVALVMDNAGWHISKNLDIPSNITVVPLPPYAPELNAMEQVWQWMKSHYLANGCYGDYDHIVDRTCDAWNAFANNNELVKSLCSRKWLHLP